MSEKITVSIVTVTYNHENYIREALENIVCQNTKYNLELIVADDCSTDKTQTIIQEYAKAYPKVIKPILRKKNIGAIPNLFDAVKMTTGKYLAICDGDDSWTDPNKIQLQVDFLEKNLNYSVSFHPTRVFFEDATEEGSIWPKLDHKKLTMENLLEENFIPFNSVVYRRQSYDSLPDGTGIMPGDWLLHIYHAQFGKIGFIDKVMSKYRRHSDSVWWDSHKDKTALWQKYGLGMLRMHSEVLKILIDHEDYKKIISKTAADILDKLVESDAKYDSGLIKKAMLELPEITECGIIYKQQVSQDLLEKYREITLLNDELLELRATSFKLRDELHVMRNSRVLGRVIKAQERVGNPYTIPRRAANNVRREAAKYVPDSIRLPLMKSLRRTRDGAKKRLYQYSHKPVKIITIDNMAWKKGLPLVSIAIPYYNRANTIDETLKSLKEQTYKNFEIIVVDDNSSDKESVEKLDELKEVKVIRHKKNQGVAAARNNGIAESRGKYIICLDSDDMLEETFVEKAVAVLEANPDISLVSTNQDMFGVLDEVHEKNPYDPIRLYDDNTVITAAMFRREAWERTGGYKSNIGYEDWEFWLTLAENGFWGKLIPEPLFKYRTSMQSRYIEDKDVHWNNIKTIRELHPDYKKRVRSLMAARRSEKHIASPGTALINMKDSDNYRVPKNGKPKVLVAMPWMTFGGAETLVYNLCRQTTSEYEVSFVTGLASKNEWEYKFKEISHNIYHLPNLFEDKLLYKEFILNLVKTRNIDILHIIHTDFVFEMLADLKKNYPDLRVIVTMFNDRVPNYVSGVVDHQQYIDIVTSDNQKTVNSFKEKLPQDSNFKVIPNGIDGDSEFNLDLFDRSKIRDELKLDKDDLAVFFVGRLSPEKNPDIFVKVAANVLSHNKNKNIKFFIIGDGPMRPKIDKQLHDIHNSNITYLGYQSEIARYLSAADIFVLPSEIEGFPLSILEAMAMEVVVIASRVGAIPDIIEHGQNGFIVTPGSVEEIETIILELNGDTKRINKIKKTERVILENTYSHKQLGSNYKNLYKDVL